MDCAASHIEGTRAHVPNTGVWPPPQSVWAFGEDGARSWRGLMSPEPGSLSPTAAWGNVPSGPPDVGRGYMPLRPIVPERAHGLLIEEQA